MCCDSWGRKESDMTEQLNSNMNKMKLFTSFYIGMRRVGSLEKTDAGRDWRQEEKGTTEDEMVG